jgi:N-acetylglucosamine-6-sulfatase
MKNKSPGLTRRKFISKLSTSAATIPLLNVNNVFDVYPFDKNKLNIERIPGTKQPNIVFILSDDHRYDFMSFMPDRTAGGSRPSFLKTPAMDKMAKEGVQFENTFVTTSLCSPSRASILTGQYSSKHGVIDNDAPEPADNIYFPEYLQKLGYETAFIGKWHMGNITDEPRKGFDKWISFKGQGVYYNPKLNIDGQEVEKEGYTTDILTDYAIEWINKKRDKPFFLYLSHKAVHAMFEPAKRHLELFDNVKIEYPESMANTQQNYEGKPFWVHAQRYGWHGVDYLYQGQIDFDTFYKRYCETILALDEGIGRVLNNLEKQNLSTSTIVFYTTDNGFTLGEHGLIDKRQMYEESIRIPLLMYAPGFVKPGQKFSEMILNIDFAPTILELAGMKKPEQMDGNSFLPLLKGKKTDWRKSFVYEYYWERPFPHTPTVFGIRTDRYKYMTYYGIWDTDELYDIKNDPQEMFNLINLLEYKEMVDDLTKQIFSWLDTNNANKIIVKRTTNWQANKRKGNIIFED